jgi:hypothetical protein
MGITDIEIQSDSRVIVEQINGSYATQETRMSECLEKVHQIYSYFDRIVIVKIPREKNGLADLANWIRIGPGGVSKWLQSPDQSSPHGIGDRRADASRRGGPRVGY